MAQRFHDRINPDAKKNTSEKRRLIAEGKFSEAENLANLIMAAIPDYQCHYEPLYDLFIVPVSGEKVDIFGLRDG